MLLTGRELTARESAATHPEALLMLASWVIKKWTRWTSFAAGVVVVLPVDEAMVLVRDRDVHARMRAVMLGLDMYGVSFERGVGAWALGRTLAEAARSQELDPELGPATEVPYVQHERKIIALPRGRKQPV